MPIFTDLKELPSEVRANLAPDLQVVWMHNNNACVSLGEEPKAETYAWTKVAQVGVTNLSEGNSYLVDLATIKLDDDDTSWVQAFPVGIWHHPKHGKIEMTPERAARFAANVNAGVRGQELDIDYDHKEKTNEASGWVKAAQAKADGLWLKIQWTAEAAQKIKQKAYRYFSPEYLDEWEEPRTKSRIKDVLLGGALTNRPFLKGILPVNLSEVLSNTKAHNDGGKMNWEEIRAMLGLAEGTPEDTVKAEFAKRLAPVASDNPPPTPEPTPPTPPTPPTEPEPEPQTPPTQPATPQLVSAAELQAQVAKLAESDPVIRAMSEQIDKLSAAAKLSEIAVKLNSLETEKVAITPAAATKLRDLMVEAPSALGEKIFDLFKETVSNGVVSLDEIGHTKPLDNSSAVKRFSDLVDAAVKADTTLSYGEAVERVSAQNPTLFTEYRNESYLKEGAK